MERPPAPQPMESEIRDRIVRYLAGELSLGDLEEWTLATTWDKDDAAEPAAADLAYSMLLLLSEHDRGDRDERSVHLKLWNLATTAQFGEFVPAVTASASVTEVLPWTQFQLAVAG